MNIQRTPCEASVFSPGQTPRMSPGLRGNHGWAGSLTSLADVLFKGPGGGGGGVNVSVGTIWSSCLLPNPASEKCAGKASAVTLSIDTVAHITILYMVGSMRYANMWGIWIYASELSKRLYRSRLGAWCKRGLLQTLHRTLSGRHCSERPVICRWHVDLAIVSSDILESESQR